MKKLLHKLYPKHNSLPPPSRITSETVAEHRERILAGGRRFKYPIQYARHKLVFNAIAISLIALIVVLVVGWWQLYKDQNTSDFMYRITKVVPVPVATADGQTVLYSDYLMKYLSSTHYLEQKEQVNLKTDDGKKQIEYIKQQSMQDVIADAYAIKLAKKLGITVSDTELEIFLKSQRQSSDGEISEQTYNAVIADYYGWSPSEYRYVAKIKLLRQKVAYAIDENAISAANSTASALKDNSGYDFKELVTSISKQKNVDATYGVSGWVPKDNQDGGLAIEATKLNKLQISKIIKSTTGSGYYIIRLIDINSTKVNYEYIKIPLTAFTQALNNVINSHKVKKYISV
jgi:DNA-binding Lrp family transcriptional regulator